MKYTENELINCLENRLKWYQEALEYKRKSEFPPVGFTLPDGNFRTRRKLMRIIGYILVLVASIIISHTVGFNEGTFVGELILILGTWLVASETFIDE